MESKSPILSGLKKYLKNAHKEKEIAKQIDQVFPKLTKTDVIFFGLDYSMFYIHLLILKAFQRRNYHPLKHL